MLVQKIPRQPRNSCPHTVSTSLTCSNPCPNPEGPKPNPWDLWYCCCCCRSPPSLLGRVGTGKVTSWPFRAYSIIIKIRFLEHKFTWVWILEPKRWTSFRRIWIGEIDKHLILTWIQNLLKIFKILFWISERSGEWITLWICPCWYLYLCFCKRFQGPLQGHSPLPRSFTLVDLLISFVCIFNEIARL